MTDERTLVADTTARLLDEIAQTTALSFEAAWAKADELGLPLLMLDETAGGFGGGWNDLLAVQWEVGRRASALPLGEAVVANWLCSRAGLEPQAGLGSFAVEAQGLVHGSRYSGTCKHVAAGRHTQWIVCIHADGSLIRLQSQHGAITRGENLAGEPRDSLTFHDALYERAPFAQAGANLAFDYGALMRLGQIAGSLTAALALTTEHVTQRVQFGKPIGAFQSVQQQLAVFAIETTAAGCAARAACDAADRAPTPHAAWYAIAAAKLRANIAIGVATATAHQLHGAIGFTQEHSLHPLTRRLWAWRTEAGNDRFWAARLGSHVAARGAEATWADIVSA
jgi:acyl-CoA dehydrogenase